MIPARFFLFYTKWENSSDSSSHRCNVWKRNLLSKPLTAMPRQEQLLLPPLCTFLVPQPAALSTKSLYQDSEQHGFKTPGGQGSSPPGAASLESAGLEGKPITSSCPLTSNLNQLLLPLKEQVTHHRDDQPHWDHRHQKSQVLSTMRQGRTSQKYYLCSSFLLNYSN